MVFAVADVVSCISCYSANAFISFYRTVCQGLDIFNNIRFYTSCQNSSIITRTIYLRIIESDVLDAATFISVTEETNISSSGIDIEIFDGLPVAIECSTIHII